ncbi:MAG: DUF1700 domain-containing protein [Clostridiales bacterium]|nr:DUF1700 domain-containing protein [Clostridiales bacterium]
MTKKEFLDELRIALSGQVPYSVINENVEYYDTYISMQVRKGMQEEEVLESLGSPRLLARTIIEAEKYAGRDPREGAQTADGTEEKREGAMAGLRRKLAEMPGWLMLVIIVLVPILCMTVLSAVFSIVFSLLGPFLLPILLILFILTLLKKR